MEYEVGGSMAPSPLFTAPTSVAIARITPIFELNNQPVQFYDFLLHGYDTIVFTTYFHR